MTDFTSVDLNTRCYALVGQLSTFAIRFIPCANITVREKVSIVRSISMANCSQSRETGVPSIFRHVPVNGSYKRLDCGQRVFWNRWDSELHT
jgi:hypothetical protein